MSNFDTPRDRAIAFIAAYEKDEPDDYEAAMVRVARTWMAIIRSPHNVQGIVNRVIDELSQPVPDDYGCAWQDLKEKFTAWAVTEEWLNPDGSIPD